jgi:hypothetical protein
LVGHDGSGAGSESGNSTLQFLTQFSARTQRSKKGFIIRGAQIRHCDRAQPFRRTLRHVQRIIYESWITTGEGIGQIAQDHVTVLEKICRIEGRRW